jgi:hypothetical protein
MGMALYRSALKSLSGYPATAGMGDSSDIGDTAVGLANSTGLTALITGVTSIFGGKSSSSPPKTSSMGLSSSSSSSPWPWIAGLGAGAVALTLILRRK